MRKKYLVKTTFAVMMAVLLAVPAGGCGNKKEPTEKTTVKAAAELTEKDLEGVISGLDDHYILENAKNIDYLHGIKYDDEIIKDVKVDNKEVKLSKTGKYTATYTVSVDVDALKKYQEEKANEEKDSSKDKGQTEEKDSSSSSKDDTDNKEQNAGNIKEEKKDSGKATSENKDGANKETTADKDTSETKEETTTDKDTPDGKEDAANETNSDSKEDASKNTADETDQASEKDDTATNNEESEKDDNVEDVDIDKEIEVVDKETAEDLADKGEVVWTDDNDTVPKTDGTKVEEVVKEPESTAGSDKPAASADKDNDEQTSTSKPNNAGSQANAGNTENSGNTSNGNSSKPAGCSHNWNAQYKTVSIPEQGHYEPIYETVTDYETRPVYRPAMVCHCGAIFFDENAYDDHAAFECSIGGWSVQEVKVGTEQVAVGSHQVQTGQKWVIDSPATTKQQLTGYRCSKCGATK